MRIFLTGGTGFIGSHFINTALENNHQIICLKRSKKINTRIKLNRQPSWLTQEINYVDKKYFRGVDVLVHMAAHSANQPYDSLNECLKYNLNYPLNLLNSALNSGIKRFIIIGSCFEYGNSCNRYEKIPSNAPLEPISSYPASKAAASIAFLQWAIENKISMSLLRVFQIYGEGEQSSRLYPSLIKAAKAGVNFPLTKGEQIRDFMDVKYLSKELLKEVELIFNKKNYFIKSQNIGTDAPQKLMDFSQNIWQKHEAKGKLLFGEKPYRKDEIMRIVPCLKPYYYQ